jgi:TRAP-type C4-dicarboxylate transport system permease small subunit
MQRAHARLRALLDPVVRLELGAATVLFTLTGVVMGAQVVARMVFGVPIEWAEDLTVFMFVWTTFLGAAVLYDRKRSLAIDALTNRFSPPTQRRLAFVVDLVLLVALAYFCKLTWDFIAIQRGMGHKLGGATGLPSYVMTVSVLIGFVSMTLSTFVSLLKPGGKARNDAAFT